MSKYIYHIQFSPGLKIGKPDGLSRRLVEENSAIYTYFFDEIQLLDLENDDVGEEQDAEDVELKGIDVATWEIKNGLYVVLL